MGRIVAHVKVTNVAATTESLRFDALVDTGSSFLVLPSVWRQRLGTSNRPAEFLRNPLDCFNVLGTRRAVPT